MSPLLLFLFISMVMAKINIELTGAFHDTDDNLKLYVTGHDIAVISEDERINFNLTDDNLKWAVKEYFGKKPNDIFLKSPTPWGDLYQTLQWQPIMRTLISKSGRILKITSRNETFLQQTFENHAKSPVIYNVGVLKTVENGVTSIWENDRLSVIDDVLYNIDVDSAGGRTAFEYTSKWGHDSEQGQFITIGTSNLEISLKSGQVITSKLQATKVDVRFEVEYMSFLAGYLATNYPAGHIGRNFWGLDIGAVMNRGSLKNCLVSKEEIDVTFFVNSRVIINDNKTRVKLMEVAC